LLHPAGCYQLIKKKKAEGKESKELCSYPSKMHREEMGKPGWGLGLFASRSYRVIF